MYMNVSICLPNADTPIHVHALRDYKEYHTDTTVRFVVTLSAEKLQEAEAAGLHKKFKLESAINTSNLVRCLFESHNQGFI